MPPRSINTKLYDALLAHKVRLVGYENYVGRQTLFLWRSRSMEIDNAIAHQWVPNQSQFSLRSAVDELGLITDDAWNETAESLEFLLMEQLDTESRIILRILWAAFPQSMWDVVGGIRGLQEAASNRIDPDIFRPISAKQASKAIRKPIAGKTWTTRIKGAKVDTRRKLQREISQGMAAGEGIPKLRRRIRDVMRTSARRADSIARTEVHHVSNRVHDASYTANKRMLAGTEYTSTLDARTCPVCGSYDRDVYYFEGTPAYESRPFIPQHPKCRCVYIPVTRFKEIFGTAVPIKQRASMFGPVTGRRKYSGWLRKQPKATVESILGKKKAALFRSGKMNLKGFVAGSRELTLAQLETAVVRQVGAAPTVVGAPASAETQALRFIDIDTTKPLENLHTRVGVWHRKNKVQALLNDPNLPAALRPQIKALQRKILARYEALGKGKRIIKRVIVKPKPIIKPIVVETKLARKARMTLEKYKARPVETLTSSSGGSRAREKTLKKLLGDRSKLPPEVADALEAELKRVQRYIVEKWHGKVVPLGKTAPIIPKPKIKVPKKVKPKPTPKPKPEPTPAREVRGGFSKLRQKKKLETAMKEVDTKIDDLVFRSDPETAELFKRIAEYQNEMKQHIKASEALWKVQTETGRKTILARSDLTRKMDRLQNEIRYQKSLLRRRLKGGPLRAQQPAQFEASSGQVSAAFTKKADAARDYISQIVDDRLLSVPKYNRFIQYKKQKGRAFYRHESLSAHVDQYAQTRVFVHETGHWVESSSRHIHKRSLEFLKMRTKGEKLNIVTKGATKAKDEWGWKDKFKEKYTGRKYTSRGGSYNFRSDRFTKDIPDKQFYATEVISMGVQQLHADPYAFWKSDPEYFRFIVGVLQGWI